MSKKTIRITWEVHDGYAGRARPQHTIFVPDDWGITAESSDEEIQDAIDEAVEADFHERVTPSVDLDEALAEVRAMLGGGDEDDD